MSLPTIPPAVRSWLYGVVTAAIPVLVVVGAVSGEQAALWLNLAAAVLGVGSSAVAVANRPTKPAALIAEPDPFVKSLSDEKPTT